MSSRSKSPRTQKRKPAPKPCGRCSGCDERRFRAWAERITRAAATETINEAVRLELAEEIQISAANRHPFGGIACRLWDVIGSLGCHSTDGDEDAVMVLCELAEDERRGRELNPGDDTLGDCAVRG